MNDVGLVLIIVTCHKVSKREIDEEGYDWEAGVPHYEHFHYNEEDEIDFAPRIIGAYLSPGSNTPIEQLIFNLSF